MSNNLFLVINIGSTSIKSRLFNGDLLVQAYINASYSDNTFILESSDFKSHFSQSLKATYSAEKALDVVLTEWQQLLSDNVIELSAIGHRVVHGASWFDSITLLTQDVLDRLIQLDHYAPLHNPLNRLGITKASVFFPETPQFAVFDTAFHRHIPEYAGRYAIPEGLSPKINFYRYGFHGISCQHALSATAEILGCESNNLNLIVLHLGGGASITAIEKGISIDTSMGFSPTEGLIMAGRSGDLDPMIPITLHTEGMSSEQVDHLLNHNSGLQGICGESNMRNILERSTQGDKTAKLAVDMFCYRIKKYLGAYRAILGHVDALVFTGGIGENSAEIRHHILAGLDKIGFLLNRRANENPMGENRLISSASSPTDILVIYAAEEREIARQILTFLGNNAPSLS